ncbi:uncharacterized protein LOC121062384 [Cygnus olor]|uniref:uncharacterized protein LOC121062384 n=1 Tax=Cygnus olor TaxID=8869 RepID=UPI001ADE289D|nr:uncharacterized protein LOC121062384 [Cygnus olor]
MAAPFSGAGLAPGWRLALAETLSHCLGTQGGSDGKDVPSLRAETLRDWLGGTQGGSAVQGLPALWAEAAGPDRARAGEARCSNEGRSSSAPLGPLRGLLPSEGGAPATPRKAAAGVLQPRVSQEKEQPDCPSCPEDLLQRRINPVRSVPDSCRWDHRVVAGKIQEQDDAWKNVACGGAGNSLLLGNRLVCVRLACPDGWCRRSLTCPKAPCADVGCAPRQRTASRVFSFSSLPCHRRKALSREMEKELIIPLPHSVRPEDND